ncbi:CDC27 family protein, partial [Escherichia coli]|nr:CDC27 family protein [Escherichia coli]
RITELVEQDEERYIQQLIALLESHGDIPFSPLFGIKHIFREDSRQVTFEWLHKLLTTYPNNDYIRLHTAYAFFRTGERQKAAELLQQVKEKRTSSFYYYLKGRLHFEDDQYTQAITYFQRSLQLDIEQHLV